MNYTEFKKTYSYAVKSFPDSCSMFSETLENIVGKCTITYFVKRGSRWIEDGMHTVESMSAEYYMNTVDAIPFFRNIGGREKVEKNYTKYGYIPTCIYSTSPDGEKKTVRKFSFA